MYVCLSYASLNLTSLDACMPEGNNLFLSCLEGCVLGVICFVQFRWCVPLLDVIYFDI